MGGLSGSLAGDLTIRSSSIVISCIVYSALLLAVLCVALGNRYVPDFLGLLSWY